ncbi:MAG: methyltransferase domain-containing protein [Pseudomonadota bacterium]
MKTLSIPRDLVHAHFTARAERYDRSSRWCTDGDILDRMVALLRPTPATRLLDLAVGTGLVSRHLRPRVGHITGLDITEAMVAQARDAVDELVISPAETMPFADGTFDAVVCRQGIQFMDLAPALAEVHRVLRPGGRFLTVDLCAYGAEDRDEYFEILRLRNPARRNFFVRGDVATALAAAGFEPVSVEEQVTVEDVDAWSDNGAIPEGRRAGIRAVYHHASEAFSALHSVQLGDGRIVDHMLFGLTVGVR